MHTLKRTVLVLGALALASPAYGDTLMTFEEFIGNEGANIGSFYTGITFTTGGSGSDWRGHDANTNLWNVSSSPSGTIFGLGEYWIYGEGFATTALDGTGNDGNIAFDNQDATYVEIAYSAFSNFHLEAYDAGGNLLDSDSGPANLRFINGNAGGPGTLRVDWDGVNHIAYVIVHDSGNFWLIDNVRTDASGIQGSVVPTPMAAGGGAVLFSLTALRRRTLRA